MPTTYSKKRYFIYDPWVLLFVFALVVYGLVMVGSASMVVSDRQHGYAFYYCVKQFAFVLLGVVLMLAVSRVPMSWWEERGRLLYLFGVLLLVLVLIPGIGHTVNGSRRWLGLGFFSLQASEVVKLMVIMYMASYLTHYHEEVQGSLGGFMKPVLLLMVLGVLLLLEPDFGALTVMTVVSFALLFIAGARLWPFVAMLSLALAAFSSLAVFSPYRLARLTSFMDPWGHAFGSGYQLTQSLIAFGRGGISGQGLGNSVQKLFYLPEAHSDFVFAVLGEELGLAGCLLLIGLIVAIALRILSIGRKAGRRQQVFAQYYCYGLAFWILVQSFINMGVNIGLLPTKGLTLPFVSYGGSSMLCFFIAVGVVLRVNYEARVTSPGFVTGFEQRKRARP